MRVLWSLLLFSFLVTSCSSPQNGLKVAATPVPHAELLEAIKPELKAQGINLIIIITEDYQMPNRALAEGEIDANFFQHIPFLNEQIKQFHYPIEALAKIELEPMGLYSNKISSITELPPGAKVAIPNDPTNEARALFLLEKQNLIQLNTKALTATPLNISSNPKKLCFIEVDAAMLPRTLSDVDLAAINTNYALEANLFNPLTLEDSDSPYANVLVIRSKDAAREDLQALKKALTSESMRKLIEQKYRGAVSPAF